jgi:hypothetical protein
MYLETFAEFRKLLANIEHWLDAAVAHGKAKSFEANTLLQSRLAPDQFPLIRQIQVACDTAKIGASLLTGKDAPKHDDNEVTVDDVRARLKSVISNLSTYTAADFAKSSTQTISRPRWEGKTMTGINFFTEHVVPNFYFHVATAYAILRHNGVSIGKKDYLGELTMSPA